MGESQQNPEPMRMIDEKFLEILWYGLRQMDRWLRRLGHGVGRMRVARLMGKRGLDTIYQKPNTSKPYLKHRGFPYLLRRLEISQPDNA